MKIDLNSDVGEMGVEVDRKIFPFITSCNIACGGHTGDAATIRETISLAKEHQVAVGAHPSYPDKENFGRSVLSISSAQLTTSIRDQVGDFLKICSEEQLPCHHIKPHGALYNQAAINYDLASVIVEVVSEFGDIPLYGLPSSEVEKCCADLNHPFIPEGFVDRRYDTSGGLVSRSLKGSVLDTIEEVLDQVTSLVFEQGIKITEWVHLPVKTLCLHSDTPKAINLARAIHEYLVEKGVDISAN